MTMSHAIFKGEDIAEPRSKLRQRRLNRLGGYIICWVCLVSVVFFVTLYTESESNHRIHKRSLSGYFPDDMVLTKPYNKSSNKIFLLVHFFGVLYMFTGIAIVCDDYFVMALEEMVDRWKITEDVAGATFMAAGGSAPELFTSIMGVFVSEDDVGFGTIVGSAVFNVLFVIGLCAVFAKEELTLTWWPLFRDCSYYSVSLGVLVLFIHDNEIVWYEAVILFIMYIIYVLIMRNNEKAQKGIENWAKVHCVKRSTSVTPGGVPPLKKSNSLRQATNEKVRVLMSRIRAVAVRSVLERRLCKSVAKQMSDTKRTIENLTPTDNWSLATACIIHNKQDPPPEARGLDFDDAKEQANSFKTTMIVEETDDIDVESMNMEKAKISNTQPAEELSKAPNQENKTDDGNDDDDDEDDDKFSWPDGIRSQLVFLITLPLVTILHFTIPDCSHDQTKKYFGITFLNSLIWIALFTYGMVWWSSIIGEALGIPTVVMGVTVLAAGTSIPDALSSIIVARRGFGDMAVSSSVGSNVFDILVGLPIPWILKTGIVSPGSIIRINSDTLVLSVATLLTMVLLVIGSIMYTKWRLNRLLGKIMFILYIFFVAETLFFAYM